MQIPLNLVVRAVIIHEGKLLLTAMDDGKRELFHYLLGGHINPDETITQCITREILEEIALEVVPSKLLYITHNFFARGTTKLHEMGWYFLCHITQPIEGDLLAALSPDLEEFVSPELVTPSELLDLNFQPSALKLLLAQDIEAGFKDRPKLLVINELPGDIATPSGVFAL